VDKGENSKFEARNPKQIQMFKIQDSKPRSNRRLLLTVTSVMLIFAGCAAQIQKPVRVCPGKESIAESLSSLRLQLENAVPLKANGQCLLQYYAEDRKPKKENFPVKLWVNPPVEIYMQGDVAFDPKGVILGSNEDEFWLAVRLKEVSGYWWGRWSEKDYPEKLMISPRLVLEALGASAFANASVFASAVAEAMADEQATPDTTADKPAVGDEGKWSLSNEGAFDVLTQQEGGAKTRKVYINNCDYLVRKVEYFGGDDRAAIVMELDKYEKITKDFSVPGVIKITNCASGNKGDSVQITLSFVKPANFTDKQRGRLFIRPQAQGFQHIYKIVDGKIIE
jgi:hypothetical protein